MKKLINTLLLILLILPFTLNAQTPVYQLPNPGFEAWDNNYANAKDEPTNWNGFPSSNCDLSVGCNKAQETRHERSTDIRPGSNGNYSCKIFATEVDINLYLTHIHATANGNITTGQINIGSTTADDATSNYNVTKLNTSGLNQPFAGKPDSISFWTKFSCPSASQYARMSCIIHDNYSMQDPYYSDEQRNHIVGEAVREYQQTNGWVEFRVPFDYNHPATTPAYLLLTFTTNKTPGEGSENDFMWIDDITMIYHAELSDLTSGGVTVPGFASNVLEYNIELSNGAELPDVGYTTLSANANATVTQATAENPTATVVVTHGDQTKTYTIHYTFAADMDAALSDLQVNGETVEGFNPIVTSYEMTLFDTVVPTVSATPRNSEATVVITQPTADDLTATVVVTDRDSSRIYTINFTLVTANADLSDLRLNGTTIEGFDPAVTEYTINIAGAYSFQEISATAASEYATMTITQPEEVDSTQYVGKVTVTCAELTKTYTVTINFHEEEDTIIGIDEQVIRSFTLYPNPANDQVTIVLDDNVNASEVVLYNMAGQTVLSQKTSESQTTLSVRNLQSGIYFVTVRNGNNILGIHKLIKE
ncbi:MAG: T9SS type A sorting domain-containing protein [Bacteroidales bacterium]|nr:T9SS type A sorting domain-containing protein [Bacteroidales bacterium]